MLTKIINDYHDIQFTRGDAFSWSPNKNEITYQADDQDGLEHLLHEVSHAQLNHKKYTSDLELIQMERAAWHHAKHILATEYDATISDELIQNDLDTYRDWLHARSSCPQCSSNGIQTAQQTYQCLVCHQTWTVNQALDCQLKRYKTK